MRIIWNENTDWITTSRLKVDNIGLIKYRESHPEKDYIGYFDITRSSQYLLGFVNLDEYEDRIEIAQMAVYSDVRHQGIGSKLLQYVQKIADERNKMIQLHVQVINIPAINFYLKHGFTIDKYDVETTYIPEGFDPNQIDINDLDEVLRLVEYRMIYKQS